MPITQFEDLAVWQKARNLTIAVYRVSGRGDFVRDFALRDQIRRAAISVMSNVAEGFERYSRQEFKTVPVDRPRFRIRGSQSAPSRPRTGIHPGR